MLWWGKKNKEPDHEEQTCCPNCGSDQWYEGPSGGAAVNIKCADCGLWFNYTPFGLDFIGVKETGGEHKRIVWYCPQCKLKVSINAGYGKYPTCPQCNRPLKVCWSCEDFPTEDCDKCDERFLCYTTKGNYGD